MAASVSPGRPVAFVGWLAVTGVMAAGLLRGGMRSAVGSA